MVEPANEDIERRIDAKRGLCNTAVSSLPAGLGGRNLKYRGRFPNPSAHTESTIAFAAIFHFADYVISIRVVSHHAFTQPRALV